jgi:hypothetical protein
MADEAANPMTEDEIVEALRALDGLPAAALLEARVRREELVPRFRRELESFVAHAPDEEDLEDEQYEHEAGPVALIFHLLAEWREKAAYRLMAQVLRSDPERVEAEFGDMRIETAPRALAAVFDGDLGPVCEIVADADADEWVRASACESFVPLVAEGLVSRDAAVQALASLRERIRPHEEHPVWLGWTETVAGLALDELKGAALGLIRQGWVDPSLYEAEDFNADFARAARSPGRIDPDEARRSLFRSVDKELDEFFAPDASAGGDGEEMPDDGIPVVNPYRYVGRNDPCPCGSGKKFKKCCGA